MPKIIDNIDERMLDQIRGHLPHSAALDVCVGYFSLTGWGQVADLIDGLPKDRKPPVRVLIGMVGAGQDARGSVIDPPSQDEDTDSETAMRLSGQIVREFRRQLMRGTPSRRDQATLDTLRRQIKEKKVEIRLFLKHPLHGKLYLCHTPQDSPFIPTKGFIGSSNLSYNGLTGNGELNVDIYDPDATSKLAQWFQDRWEDPLSLKVDDALLEAIDQSWASPTPFQPYDIYLKMAYHLSSEARAGLAEFGVPARMEGELLDFQAAAIKIAARHLSRRGGVLVGDVVGLGKTLVGTALALLWRERTLDDTLILCPKNLVKMWRRYSETYSLGATILSLSEATKKLPAMHPHGLVMIDESHNLRNRDGITYAAVKDYIGEHDARVVMLSATPYNKAFTDLGNQLRLFTDETADLGIRPEALIRGLADQTAFLARCQGSPSSLLAFEASQEPDDWRDLMRLFLVRRTRTFIREQYAKIDSDGRQYLLFPNGTASYFPERIAKTVKHTFSGPDDPAQMLVSEAAVTALNNMSLPRYGLNNYVNLAEVKTPRDKALSENLTRAGNHLIGLTRSGLFKRLESSGHAFVLSAHRHRLRNLAFIHAMKNGLDLPIGTVATSVDGEVADSTEMLELDVPSKGTDRQLGEAAYVTIKKHAAKQIRWIPARLFSNHLVDHLAADNQILGSILSQIGKWTFNRDSKAALLLELVKNKHPTEKVLVFTQFADTAVYLYDYLANAGLPEIDFITGGSGKDVADIVRRFSPTTNVADRNESRLELKIRVLIATDVISEGQNLQDAAIVVNYDLPWAIIRLVQRAGRVDRIGQTAENILVYSFVPADDVEKVLNLRERVRRRLNENNRVIGGDEAFFDIEGDDDADKHALIDLYNEKATVLNDPEDVSEDVDLGSYALQIWRQAVDQDPDAERRIPALADVVGATRDSSYDPGITEGVLTYIRTAAGTDSLVRVDLSGQAISYSPLAILQAAACSPDTPGCPLDYRHHALVAEAETISARQSSVINAAGALSGTRRRVYQRMSHHLTATGGTLFTDDVLADAVEALHNRALTENADRILRQRLRDGISDLDVAELLIALHADDVLCRVVTADKTAGETHIVCSVGLFNKPQTSGPTAP